MYKDEKKRFEQYRKQTDLRCYHTWDLTLDQLFAKKDKTPEQEKFLFDYETHNKFINSACELNRICKYIESIKFDLKKIARDENDFNIDFFFSSDVEFNQITYKNISNILKQFLSVQDTNRQCIITMPCFDKTSENEFDIDDEFINVRIDICEKFCSSEKEYVNYLIRFFYRDNKKYNKSLLWKLCGDCLYRIALNKCNGVIKFPFLDMKGDMKFLLNNYSVKTIDLKELEGGLNNVQNI